MKIWAPLGDEPVEVLAGVLQLPREDMRVALESDPSGDGIDAVLLVEGCMLVVHSTGSVSM